MKFIINPTSTGALGIIEANNKENAIKKAKGSYGLNECWVMEIKKEMK